jgi:hypothetical protein
MLYPTFIHFAKMLTVNEYSHVDYFTSEALHQSAHHPQIPQVGGLEIDGCQPNCNAICYPSLAKSLQPQGLFVRQRLALVLPRHSEASLILCNM